MAMDMELPMSEEELMDGESSMQEGMDEGGEEGGLESMIFADVIAGVSDGSIALDEVMNLLKPPAPVEGMQEGDLEAPLPAEML